MRNKYSIETLEIELNRIKRVLRTIEANQHEIMSNISAYDEYLNKTKELESSIEELKQ